MGIGTDIETEIGDGPWGRWCLQAVCPEAAGVRSVVGGDFGFCTGRTECKIGQGKASTRRQADPIDPDRWGPLPSQRLTQAKQDSA